MGAPASPARVLALIIPVAALILPFSGALASSSGATTTWFGGFGDWGDGANWSGGEPTALSDAVVPIGTSVITLTGETCRRLDVASGNQATVRINSGALNVVETIQIGVDDLGTFQQIFGTVTANELVIGGPASGGAYLITSGSLTLGSANLASTDNGASGIMSMANNAVCTITGSLDIAAACDFTIGSGTLAVGTSRGGGVTVDGVFSFSGTPTVTFSSFTMTPNGTLSETLVSTDHGYIDVTGAAVIDGTLLVLDLSLPDGSYEIMRAGSMTGGFDSIFSTPGWAWRITGNSLFLDKDSTPVETVGWGAIKDRYRP